MPPQAAENKSEHGFDGQIFARSLLKSAQTRQGFAVVLPRSDENLLRQNSEGLKMCNISAKYGAEIAGWLAPAKIDKPNFAEILPLAACLDLFSVASVNDRGIVTMTEVYSVLAFVLLLVAFAKVLENIKK